MDIFDQAKPKTKNAVDQHSSVLCSACKIQARPFRIGTGQSTERLSRQDVLNGMNLCGSGRVGRGRLSVRGGYVARGLSEQRIDVVAKDDGRRTRRVRRRRFCAARTAMTATRVGSGNLRRRRNPVTWSLQRARSWNCRECSNAVKSANNEAAAGTAHEDQKMLFIGRQAPELSSGFHEGPNASTPLSAAEANGAAASALFAFKHSYAGFRSTWRAESAFRQETVCALVLVPCGLLS